MCFVMKFKLALMVATMLAGGGFIFLGANYRAHT